MSALVRTHQLGDVRRMEAALEHRFPRTRVLERQVTLRTVKLVGRLLDEEGRAAGYVPIGPADLAVGSLAQGRARRTAPRATGT